MKKCTRNVLFSAVLLLLIATTASADMFHAGGDVTLIASSEYFAASNASDGNPSSTWVTDAPCGGSADYFDCETAPIPVMVMDLGSDIIMDGISIWNYSTGNANNITEFSLRFATEAEGAGSIGASIGFNPEFTTYLVGNAESDDFVFDSIVVARYVEMTITDNGFGGPLPGGDRAGFGEIQFSGKKLKMASIPYPADNAINIEVDGVKLSWDVAIAPDPSDPNIIFPDPGLVRHELYLGTGEAADPNVYYVGPVDAGDPIDARIEYAAMDLNRDSTYYWRVDEVITDANGNDFAHTGNIWTFQTLPSDPVIPFDSPSGLLSGLGEDAAMSVIAWNPYSGDDSGLSFQWYKVDAAGDIAVGEDSADLTITGVTPEKEGLYYCVVTIVEPDVGASAVSRQANLVIKKRIGYWPFEGDATDLDNGNNGVPMGTPDFTAEGIVNGGQAMQLVQAESDYISIPNDPLEWSPTGSFSVSVWVKVTGGTGHRCVISNRHEPPTQGFIIYNEPGSTWQYWTGQTTLWSNLGGPAVVNNEWTHLVITCEPTGLSETDENIFLTTKRLFVNGELASQGTGNYRIKELNTSDLFIGAGRNENPAAYFFDGLIDDLRIYNYPIESLKVAQLFTDVQGGEVCYDKPAYDFNDDCITSLADFAVLAVEWMECNLVPVTECQ